MEKTKISFRIILEGEYPDGYIFTDPGGNRCVLTNKYNNIFWNFLNKLTFRKYFNKQKIFTLCEN